MSIITLEFLKESRKKYLDASIIAYKEKSSNFSKLWDKFMDLNKSCIIFTDFPIIYELYISSMKDPSNFEKQHIYAKYFHVALNSLKVHG